MKIFEIKINEGSEWVCANSVLDALRFYKSLTDNDVDDIDDVVEVPEEKWSEMTIVDPDDYDENDIPRPIQTFAERVKDETEPELIASTFWD